MMRKALLLAVVLALLFSSGSTTSASSIDQRVGDNEKDSGISLLTNKEMESLSFTIQQVFSSVSMECFRDVDRDLVTDEVVNGIQRRINAVNYLAEVIQCVFDSVEVLPEITAIKPVSRSKVMAEVYLTTGVTYHYPGIEDSSDFFAYGVSHIVELEDTENVWRVVSDSFDERDVTGVISGVNTRTEETGICFSERVQIPQDDEQMRSTFTYNASKVRSALNYAMTFCGFPPTVRKYHSVTGIDPSNSSQSMFSYGTQHYNHAYDHPYASTRDCANFVSQCLYEAGMPTDSDWTFGPYKEYWIAADKLVEYLTVMTGNGTAEQMNSSYNNIFPGNPVFWYTDSGESSNHIMMCTGYNTAGIPVVCGHTTNVYRIPVAAFSSAHIIRTVKMATYNLHSTHTVSSGLWYHDSTYHYHLCDYCEYPCNKGAHIPGMNLDCTVCGALYPYD